MYNISRRIVGNLLSLWLKALTKQVMKLIKRILPDLIAILAFIIIPTIYFAPAAFEGRILAQHDSVAGIGNGQESREYHERTGKTTRWSNSIFGGMPTYQSAPSYDSTNILETSTVFTFREIYGSYSSCCSDFTFCSGHSTSPYGCPRWELSYGLFPRIISSSSQPDTSGSLSRWLTYRPR